MFINAIEYNLRHKKDFDPKEYVDLYFNIYGVTKKLSKLILTAILENYPKLEKALTKYYKQ